VLAADLISDEYRSGPHRASLFANVVNVDCGEAHERQMTSGKHTIRTIYCIACATELGWTYVAAENRENQYKIGKFILIQPFVRKHQRTPSNAAAASSEREDGKSPTSEENVAAPAARSSRDRSGSLASSTLSPSSAAAASAFARSAGSSRRSSFGHVNIISSRVSSPESPRSTGAASSSSSSSSSASESEASVASEVSRGSQQLRRVLAQEHQLHRTLQSMEATITAIERRITLAAPSTLASLHADRTELLARRAESPAADGMERRIS
jgi:hypothetical protein